MTLERLELALRSGLGVLLSMIVAAIAVICFVEVILRYLLGASLAWYDEFVGYLLVWLTFLGAVLAQSHGQHIGVQNFVDGRNARTKWVLQLSNHAVLVAVHVVLLIFGAQLALRFLGELASTLPVPMGVVYSVIPVSAALMLLVEGIRITRLLRR